MPVIIRAGGRIRFEKSGPRDGPKPPKRPPCEFCGRPEHSFAAEWGWHVGSSSVLRDNMLDGADADVHPWHTGRWSIAAHHLICSEAMADDEVWAVYCRLFGYDINRKENGVILPMVLAVACELHVPVHVGPHAGGWAFDMDMAYPDAVKRKLMRVAELVEAGGFCARPDLFVEKLDTLSREILGKVSCGKWTLTTDGLDYQLGGYGCAGVSSIQDKPRRACPHGRRHGARHGRTGAPLPRRTLQVGA
ncbi:AHH domain-containing protein [Pyxidicoccus parkwayensis]|uniref:AHH domain-containing protein n=2 Tax=Pyxidicoccus parkwayensis TaxID=2813578 RepID=A0ABX7PC70_9BACT|nr:AHH domain-containing protein [Pyxidicoccus parkwaysis]